MRFLIVRMSAFGDIIHAYPVLHYLKTRFPDCSVDWVVEKQAASLVRAHPLVDNVIELDAKRWKKKLWNPRVAYETIAFYKSLRAQEYEAVFDLQSNAKSAFVMMLTRAKDKVGYGWKTAHERISCMAAKHRYNPPRGQNIRRDNLSIVQNYFKDDTPFVPEEMVSLRLTHDEDVALKKWKAQCTSHSWMICPGSFWENKKMSREGLMAFLTLCEKSFHPHLFFLSGSEAERKEAEYFAAHCGKESIVLDRPTLPLLQHLMREMKLVVAMDSLPLHLAGTCGIPTFSVFGPSVSFKFRPLGDKHFSYQGNCPYGQQFLKRCSSLRSCKTGACMRDIDPKELFSAFSKFFQEYVHG